MLIASLIAASVCISASGNESSDKTIATALAKGQLAQQLSVTVTARSSLKSVSVGNGESTDSLTETVTVESKQQFYGIRTISSDYEPSNETEQYCVSLEIESQ